MLYLVGINCIIIILLTIIILWLWECWDSETSKLLL